jgi:hypothetical protein
MRARCERTALERRQATYNSTGDFGSAMPFLSIDVMWGRAIGRVCKPEVAGSSPTRSIKTCKLDASVAFMDMTAVQQHVRGGR